MKQNPIIVLAATLVTMLSLGWILYIGRPIILPLVTAVIVVYIMTSVSNAIHQNHVLRHVPLPVVRFSLLVGFTAIFYALAVMTASTVREISAVTPQYEANIDRFLEGIATRFGLDRQTVWDEVHAATIGAFDLHSVLVGMLGGFTNVGATVFLIAIYAAFLMGERRGFSDKIKAAFETPDQANLTLNVVREINHRISDYLVVKTLINIVLGGISFVILWFFGVDFALFWAVLIGFLNYIPYVGSIVGVVFPVVLSLAQFGSLGLTLALAVLLTIAQMVMGNYIEPRVIGRQVNLSPLVVLVALSVWTALWGIPGAILAVPLTSVMAIILGSFDGTRFIAVLLADQVEPESPAAETRQAEP